MSVHTVNRHRFEHIHKSKFRGRLQRADPCRVGRQLGRRDGVAECRAENLPLAQQCGPARRRRGGRGRGARITRPCACRCWAGPARARPPPPPRAPCPSPGTSGTWASLSATRRRPCHCNVFSNDPAGFELSYESRCRTHRI